ncbi:MAG: chemotaxis protein CheD [Methanomicrobiaceae archaeon]|nr:chemotaxis protein CheD [Methanomicrobiaceae archaeon]
MTSIGLGSCVAVMIFDKKRGIGTMAHVMLPDNGGKCDRPGKYANTAIPILITELIQAGCTKRSLEAKIAGGASMFKSFRGNLNIGDRNVEALKKILEKHSIPIVGEDVGGTSGRSVYYFPLEKGRASVKRADGTCTDF